MMDRRDLINGTDRRNRKLRNALTRPWWHPRRWLAHIDDTTPIERLQSPYSTSDGLCG